MEEIAENEYYELSYDPPKNRVYWTMKGFWGDMSVVPNFDRDWDEAQSMTRPGFTIFADLSKLKVMPEDVKEAQDERQQKLLNSGCRKVSCLIESTLTTWSLNKVLKDSGMDKVIRYFAEGEGNEAERWLDAH